MKTCVTYGKGNKFIKDLLPDVKDLNVDIRETMIVNKVRKTLWGSPVDANYGWKQWCTDEEFCSISEDDCFYWTLKPEARILTIRTIDDLETIPFNEDGLSGFYHLSIDFKSIIENYDAMELEDAGIGHMFKSDKEICFNSWDCESIMVFNKEMIVPLEK